MQNHGQITQIKERNNSLRGKKEEVKRSCSEWKSIGEKQELRVRRTVSHWLGELISYRRYNLHLCLLGPITDYSFLLRILLRPELDNSSHNWHWTVPVPPSTLWTPLQWGFLLCIFTAMTMSNFLFLDLKNKKSFCLANKMMDMNAFLGSL